MICNLLGWVFLVVVDLEYIKLSRRKLARELMELWAVATDKQEAAEIKRKSIRALRLGSYCKGIY